MVFSFARRFAGLEKPSQDNAEYLNGGIASWPSRATKSPVYSALRWARDLEHWTKPLRGMQRIALSKAAGISIETESFAT
jgi:hypothetical protein